MPFDAEVIVVGAGPAGSATALGLAARGHDVLLLDRRTFPRDKVCGEGLLPHGVDALRRLGVAPPAGARPFRGIAWHLAGHRAVGTFPDGEHGLGMRRTALDEGLLRAARAHPRVCVRTGVAVRGVTAGPAAVEVDAGERLRARAVVGADGIHSVVRRSAGLDARPRGRRRYALRGHFRLAGPDPDRVEVHALDGAELYVTPTAPGEVNVAALAEASVAKGWKGDLAGALERLVRDVPALRAQVEGRADDVRATGPLRNEATDVVADHLLLVGDAAGFVDGITGEGTSVSLLGASLAAEVLSAGLRTGRLDRASLAPYGARRRRAVRDLERITEIVLWGVRRPVLAARVVRNLARDPALFDRILAIDTGRAPLASVGLRGLFGLLRP